MAGRQMHVCADDIIYKYLEEKNKKMSFLAF